MTQREIYRYAILGLLDENDRLFRIGRREEKIEENIKKIQELNKLMNEAETSERMSYQDDNLVTDDGKSRKRGQKMKNTMTKAEMLTAMTSVGNAQSYLYYHMQIRKAYIQEAFRRFNEISHTAGRKYLEECRHTPERCFQH